MHSFISVVHNEMYSLKKRKEYVTEPSHALREAKVLPTSRHGRVESLLQGFVVIILGEIEFWEEVSRCKKGELGIDLRLKQVWLDGRRSLLP